MAIFKEKFNKFRFLNEFGNTSRIHLFKNPHAYF